MKPTSPIGLAAAIATATLLTATLAPADVFNLGGKKDGADGVPYISGTGKHNLRLEDPSITVAENHDAGALALVFTGAQVKPAVISFGEGGPSASVRLKILANRAAGDTDETILMYPGNFELRRSPKSGALTLYIYHKDNEPPVAVKSVLPAGKWSELEIRISGSDVKLSVDGKEATGQIPEGGTMAAAKSFFRIGATQDGRRPFDGQLTDISISVPAE